ncbi:NifB/NifX family molybdenum-iron cluster-binding protein [Desulfothermobacter acidiphilus]|uniref:NifB/NifX family molybdenum-iron cluster-binding protein n=1 Tax=Desulfothermobacter acidiphilus TaxID=1938353 RepID=UPI003F8BD057
MEGKIAIAALGDSPDAAFSRHFATATHFLIYDTASGDLEAVENPARDLPAGRGVAVADLLIGKGVKGVVTGLIGPRPFARLQEAGIKVYPGPRIKVQEVINAIKAEQLSPPLEAPTEAPHAGEHGGCLE